VTAYVDSSALLKRYLIEPDSALGQSLLDDDVDLVTSRITIVEVRRALGLLASAVERVLTRANFAHDLESISIVEVDALVCADAASIAEETGLRSLDSIHVASARRLSDVDITFITFDVRQAAVARSLGLTVLGA
jgi:predicted nucleic acid-binding protein